MFHSKCNDATIGATIQKSKDIQCLPYAGFFFNVCFSTYHNKLGRRKNTLIRTELSFYQYIQAPFATFHTQ